MLELALLSLGSLSVCYMLCVYNSQLDMEDGDAIDVFQQQTGGHMVAT